MKRYFHLLLILVISPVLTFAQFGLKGGLNFARVTKASNINADNSTGFHAGVFIGTKSKGVLGYRTELIYSRQGYDFKSGTTTGSVDLDYLLLPQLMEINITKVFSIQIGAQMAYLLNAKADSTKPSTGNAQVDKLVDLMNRFDFGAAGGIEIHPYEGILIGARMNISLYNLYKDPVAAATRPNFFPNVDAKNNVIQIFAGYRF